MSLFKSERRMYLYYSFSLLSIFILRIYLSEYLTLYGDLNVFVKWGARISKVGFSDFYSTYWCDYMPGYLYILRALNGIHSMFPDLSKEILYKLPANIGDLIISILIFAIIRRYYSASKAFLASILFFLNPALLANSTFWGQIDSFHALPVIISCLFALRQRIFLSGLFITIGFLIKPQTIIIFPVIAALNFIPLLKTKPAIVHVAKKSLIFILSIFLTTFVILLPFIIKDLAGISDVVSETVKFTLERFMGSYGQYEKASLNAFNFWGIIAMWQSDHTRFLKLTYQTWGTVMFFALYLIIYSSLLYGLFKTSSEEKKKKFILSFQSICLISFVAFLFLTRVHERHLLTTIVFLSFIAITARSRLYIYFTTSFIYVLNMIYAYGKLTEYKTEFSSGYFKPIIFVTSSILILSLVFLLIDFIKISSLTDKLKILKTKLIYSARPVCNRKNLTYLILLLLFALSFSLKINNLDHPSRYYFDENFFAFTAQEMARNNPLGWQKGERAPGKAEYEWTHPPLGKEITAVGILIFGDKTSSWRIMQAIFGALGTIFIFFLGKNLFNSTNAGIFASFLYTFESFIHVFSRIALVDIYLFNFLILASLFFIKFVKSDKLAYLCLSAVFAGCAMSVKWSGAFIIGFLLCSSVVITFYKSRNSQSSRNTIIQLLKATSVFVFIPIIVYLATYIPYFLNGNSITDFVSFQDTIFDYHKNVSKQHVYRSQWWSWPLMIRPVCLYIEKIGDYREYIYSFGNPAIWWGGLLAIIFSIYYTIRYKYYPLAFIVLSFIAYLIPWSISPRKITYIYHYMPSLLFVILALSFFLDRLWRKSYRVKIIVAYFLITVIASFIFFYPVINADKVPRSEMKQYRWMRTWR